MSNQKNAIYLAAMLHDIGKFFQRADPDPYWSSKVLSQASKNLGDVIWSDKEGFDGNNNPTHHHVMWTHEFFSQPSIKRQFEPLGLKISPHDPGAESNDDLVSLAINHHTPNTKLQALIQLADYWANGLDRSQQESIPSDAKSFKEVALLSVFSQIEGEDKKHFYVPMKSQGLEEDRVMPLDKEEFNYTELWNEFLHRIESMPLVGEGQFSAFSENLLYLLRKFTSSIPAGTFKEDLPAVSLYDHLKVTSSIADCLYAYAESNGIDQVFDYQTENYSFLKLRPGHEQPLLLACVDLSGIQSFIYNISGSRAAKSLKGRSFYLQLLVDTIIDRLVLDNGLGLGHVLYSSGGKAYLLMPNIQKVKNHFKDLHQEVINKVYEEHGQELYVCMDYVSFGYDARLKVICENPQANQIGELWKLLGEKTGKQKQRKYEDYLVLNFDDFFRPEEIFISEKVCAVTGKMLTDDDAIDIKGEKDDEPLYVCKSVNHHIELGKKLKDADFILTFSGAKKWAQLKEVKGIEPLGLGIHKYLFDQEDLTEEHAEFRKITSFDYCRVQYINQTNFEAISKLKGPGTSYGYLFYGGNKQVEAERAREKLYDELATGESFSRLGILRMDVDNLGDLFIRRIPEKQRNLATYATLSSQLDMFFSGYLNVIRKKENYRNHVNILYAGGDDVFAIGRWKEIVDFSLEVRKAFRQFIGGRGDITLSAGISLVGGKFPISKAADLAGEAEAEAKKYNRDGKTYKDALTFLETTLSWDEFHEVRLHKDEFSRLCEKGQITKSLLQKLIQYHLQKEFDPKDFSYIWKAAYFLKRYKTQEPDAEALKKSLTKNIVESGVNTNYLQKIALAARWAELEMRTLNTEI